MKSDLQFWIEQRLEASNPRKISDYAYFGELPLGDTWGSLGAFGLTRDTDEPIEIANRMYVEHHLKKHFPKQNNWCIEKDSHWAVGWVDSIKIQMLTKRGKPTAIAKYCFENFIKRVEQYASLDDDLVSAIEGLTEYANIDTIISGNMISDDFIDDYGLAEKRAAVTWLDDQYPELLNFEWHKEYPIWVYEVRDILSRTFDYPDGDHNNYSSKQVLQAAWNFGIFGDEDQWPSYLYRWLEGMERDPMVQVWYGEEPDEFRWDWARDARKLGEKYYSRAYANKIQPPLPGFDS